MDWASDTVEHITRVPVLSREDVDIWQIHWEQETSKLDEVSSWAQLHVQGDWVKMGIHHNKLVYKQYVMRQPERTAYCYAVVDDTDPVKNKWWVSRTFLGHTDPNDVVMCAPLSEAKCMPTHGWEVPWPSQSGTPITPVVGPKVSTQFKIITALSRRIKDMVEENAKRIEKEKEEEAKRIEREKEEEAKRIEREKQEAASRRRAEATVIILQKELDAAKQQLLDAEHQVLRKDYEILEKDDALASMALELELKVETERSALAAQPLSAEGPESGGDGEAGASPSGDGRMDDEVDGAEEAHPGVVPKHVPVVVAPPPKAAGGNAAQGVEQPPKPPPAVVPKSAAVTHPGLEFLHPDVLENASWYGSELYENDVMNEETGGGAAKRKADELS
jgi:hypothetical protein